MGRTSNNDQCHWSFTWQLIWHGLCDPPLITYPSPWMVHVFGQIWHVSVQYSFESLCSSGSCIGWKIPEILTLKPLIPPSYKNKSINFHLTKDYLQRKKCECYFELEWNNFYCDITTLHSTPPRHFLRPLPVDNYTTLVFMFIFSMHMFSTFS